MEWLSPKEKYLTQSINLNGMPKAKVNKLLDYCEKDPRKFIQYDAFVNVEHGDDVVKPDKNGDSLFNSNTIELMTGNIGVRVLIVPGTTREITLRVLRKIADWIEREPETLELKDDAVGKADLNA